MNKIEEKLTYFYSIGPVQAKKVLARLISLKLVDESRAKKDDYTISDLKKILKNKKIYDDLSDALKEDLTYNPLRVIPRPIIDIINEEFHKYVKGVKFDIAGSYLRKKVTSGDIDMVICTKPKGDKTWEFVTTSINKNSKIFKIMEPFAMGDNNVSVLFKVNIKGLYKKYPEFKKLFSSKKDYDKGDVYVKTDIFLSDPDEYMFALLYATGSGKFNLRMRALAKRKGYFLNQHGLFKKLSENVLERVNVKTEQEVFDVLGMTYKIPEKRIL